MRHSQKFSPCAKARRTKSPAFDRKLHRDGKTRCASLCFNAGVFWSFTDPRETVCKDIVDLDQVEAIETSVLAFHEDHDEQNNSAFLLRKN